MRFMAMNHIPKPEVLILPSSEAFPCRPSIHPPNYTIV